MHKWCKASARGVQGLRTELIVNGAHVGVGRMRQQKRQAEDEDGRSALCRFTGFVFRLPLLAGDGRQVVCLRRRVGDGAVQGLRLLRLLADVSQDAAVHIEHMAVDGI